ncbi:MAG: D-alanine--D-alanine ligase [Lachnospiraceae bacterium]|nr:D-alanine--D-alanine ligase [Lachnospiraceae bacterium]
MSLNVCILSGGSSYEREVSFMTSSKIKENLDKTKYNIYEIEVPINPSGDWIKELIDSKPDITIIALHGGIGENGSVQGLLNCLGFSYLGSDVLGSAIGMDKHFAKMVMRSNFIPVCDDVFIKKKDINTNYAESVNLMGYPVVVKPNCGGSGVGISFVNDESKLYEAVKKVADLNDDILIEKLIPGNEVTCGVVEKDGALDVMSVLDIGITSGVYDYSARYYDVDRTKIEFSTLPEYQKEMIREIAKKTFLSLECSGYARIDMIVSEEQVYVLEINTLPGMTSKSLIPKSLEGRGLNFGVFLDDLINEKLKAI